MVGLKIQQGGRGSPRDERSDIGPRRPSSRRVYRLASTNTLAFPFVLEEGAAFPQWDVRENLRVALEDGLHGRLRESVIADAFG